MHNHTRERSQHPCCRRVTSLFQTNRRSKLFKFDRNSSTRTKRSDDIKPSEPLSEPRRPCPEQLHRAPTTSTTDRVDHVLSSSAELRPPRPQDYVAMMIAAKNGATTITTTAVTISRKARGPDNFITNDTSSHLSNIATCRLHPPVVNKAKYYF